MSRKTLIHIYKLEVVSFGGWRCNIEIYKRSKALRYEALIDALQKSDKPIVIANRRKIEYCLLALIKGDVPLPNIDSQRYSQVVDKMHITISYIVGALYA